MAATIRPSLILNMDVDERQFSDDLVAETRRSYSYVAPSVVVATPASADEPIENTIRLVVRMHRPYWDANDEASQEQWEAIMPQWLDNMFYKVSSTVAACNDIRTRDGNETLPYAWMEVEFDDNLTLAQATEACSAFPEDALAVAERVRDLCAAGVFGADVVRVSVPARSVWEEARSAACAAAADEAESETVVDAEAPTDAEVLDDGESAVGALPFAPDFAVERRLWGVEHADGTVSMFDSSTESFVE